MLIDFKIRALFIWTDPYLPDLTDTQSGPWFWSHTTIKYLDRGIFNKNLICSQKVKEWTLKKRQTHFTRNLMRTWLKMKFFNYWTQKSLFFVYPYFTLDVNTWYECLIQILSEIKNLTFLNFKNFLNSFKMLSLLFWLLFVQFRVSTNKVISARDGTKILCPY